MVIIVLPERTKPAELRHLAEAAKKMSGHAIKFKQIEWLHHCIEEGFTTYDQYDYPLDEEKGKEKKRAREDSDSDSDDSQMSEDEVVPTTKPLQKKRK